MLHLVAVSVPRPISHGEGHDCVVLYSVRLRTRHGTDRFATKVSVRPAR